MKSNLKILVLILALSGISNAAFCGADSTANAGKQEEYLQIYHQAINYNDMSTAASALVGYLNAGGAASYRDSLAIVYYNLNNMGGAYKMANELFTENPKNVTALTLLADISGRSGETKISLDWYEKLCALSPGPYNFYQMAAKQFVLDRRSECRQTLQRIIADSVEAMKQPVSMEISSGNFEEVPALAAAYNMLGVMAFNEKENEKAKEYYSKAIAVAPDFKIARQNIEALKPASPTKAGQKPPTPTGGKN